MDVGQSWIWKTEHWLTLALGSREHKGEIEALGEVYIMNAERRAKNKVFVCSNSLPWHLLMSYYILGDINVRRTSKRVWSLFSFQSLKKLWQSWKTGDYWLLQTSTKLHLFWNCIFFSMLCSNHQPSFSDIAVSVTVQ